MGFTKLLDYGTGSFAVSKKLYRKIMGVALMLPMLVFAAPNPYEFMVSKPFFFNQVGECAEFVVNISDAKRYELALETSQEIFPESVMEESPFNWKVEVSVWCSGKKLDQRVLGPLVAGWPLDNNSRFFARISLGILPALRSWFFTKEFTVRVVVIQVDERYMDENLPVRIGIRPSPLE